MFDKIVAHFKRIGVEGVLFYLLLLATTVILPIGSYIYMLNLPDQLPGHKQQ